MKGHNTSLMFAGSGTNGCGKIAYITRAAAKKVEKLGRSTRDHMDVYKCPTCSLWHVGHGFRTTKPTGITPKVRRIVLLRAEGLCERCGTRLDTVYYSLQHRRARGMGGSRLTDTNLPSNLVALCGSATTGCHGHIESNPLEAFESGLRLRQGESPTLPVLLRYGLVHLDDDGTWTFA